MNLIDPKFGKLKWEEIKSQTQDQELKPLHAFMEGCIRL
jgi:hypothetical protein